MSISFSQRSPLPRIKNLILGKTLGQGSFAFVKAARLESNPNTVIAVKFVHLPTCRKQGLSEKSVTQEVIIQSKCNGHLNILEIIDCNLTNDFLWIAMELASGGDLFDKIEPDVGVDSEVARFYFKQLINAIDHLHNRCGVAHRDIKPENLLLDERGNLKLADFGLASQFKRKDGSKRVMSDTRGSLPYMAPEIVYSKSYYADSTDIWSCGVLVFVLLTGETPWDSPSDDSRFDDFLENSGGIASGSWAKIDISQLNLLRKMLHPDPARRATAEQLKSHNWYSSPISFADENAVCTKPELLSEKLLSKLHISLSDEAYLRSAQDSCHQQDQRHSSTQPVLPDMLQHDKMNSTSYAATQCGTYHMSHEQSQFVEGVQDVCGDMATQQFRESAYQGLYVINPSRLTKFYSTRDTSVILSTLEASFRCSGIPVTTNLLRAFNKLKGIHDDQDVFPLTVQIVTKDRKGWHLSGSVKVLEINDSLKLICFNRKSGDPLEWRRLFKKLSILCRDLIYLPQY